MLSAGEASTLLRPKPIASGNSRQRSPFARRRRAQDDNLRCERGHPSGGRACGLRVSLTVAGGTPALRWYNHSPAMFAAIQVFAFVLGRQRGLAEWWQANVRDTTFKGLYQLNAFDLALLIPYFAVLIILASYGMHR